MKVKGEEVRVRVGQEGQGSFRLREKARELD